MKRIVLFTSVFVLLCMAPVMAQGSTCPAIVQTVLENLNSICENTGRNQACYGNIALDAQPREGVTDFSFQQIGDIEDVTNIASLRLSPMNEANTAWGVAMMRLQASLPDALPGQNVTFLLFGDVELVNAASTDDQTLRPMQAFYLRTGIGDSACAEAPESGLVVQTPQGRGQINFLVNGVNVALGSTAVFQAQPGQPMRVKTLQGAAVTSTENWRVPIIAGTELQIPMNDDLTPAGAPGNPVSYAWETVQPIPYDLLDEPIEPTEPLDEDQLNELYDLLGEGLPPCGEVDFLPGCDELIEAAGGEYCALGDDGERFDCGADDLYEELFWGGLDVYDYDEINYWGATWEEDFWDAWDGMDNFNGEGSAVDEGDSDNQGDFDDQGSTDDQGDYDDQGSDGDESGFDDQGSADDDFDDESDGDFDDEGDFDADDDAEGEG